MAELAYSFGWGPRDLAELEVDELMVWHEQLARIGKNLEPK